MESNKLAIAALLFILLIVGINFAMYAIARGSVGKGDSNFMKSLRALGKTPESESEKSMDELRKRIQDLENEKKAK